ncbi:MAG: ribosomal-protein-alanine N-acetyltransferase [Calditrichaeota bacterium]|nr:MAG: ribosomal-protein-alanine N-acetyltransferase [Calditrichota bacterium]
MSLRFRRMHPEDLDRVWAIEQAAFTDPWTRDMLAAELQPDYFRHPIVLEMHNRVEGYALLWVFDDEIYLNNIAINPENQRKGLGLKFLNYIFERFRSGGILHLEVRPSNKAAVQLYSRCGFAPVGIRRGYYSDGEDALIMQKELE